MKKSIDTLVAQFRAGANAHFAATLAGNYRKTNMEADKIHSTFLKLKEAGDEAREALIQLTLEGETPQAVMAATYSLKYDAKRSMEALKRLSKDRGMLGFKAEQALKRWQSGEWRLE